MGTAKAIANVRSLKRKTILFDLKITIIYATLAYVSAAVKTNTLQLNGSAVYGHSFDLVCFTEVNVDVPYATFIRRISLSQEGSGIATILYYSSINSCYLTPTSYKNYTYRCNNEGKNITLTVPAENEVEHNTFWVCANQGSENEENNNVINVFVNDPVRNVSIVNNTVVIVTEGISVTFACETSPCRPSADIYWMKNGINITDPQANNSIHQSGTKNITLSSLRFSLSRRDNGSLLSCGAYNGYGTRTLSANVTSIVYYSPDDSPSIYGYSNTSVVKVIEKMSYTLICSITGGNPLASLSWICFGIVGSNDIVAQRVNSTINLNVQRNRTGQHCQCISSQEIQGSRTVLIAVEVLYSPTVNPFKSPLKVIQGQPLVVVCNADGNPTPQMTWNPAGEDSRNKSRLVYSAISRENAVIHRCAAKNDMVPTTDAPSVNPFTSPVNVIQGKPLVVECSADGNPSPQLKWNPAGEDSMNKSRLYYSAISRDKAVIHTCTARNDMVPTTGSSKPGSDSKELVIEVLSPTQALVSSQ